LGETFVCLTQLHETEEQTMAKKNMHTGAIAAFAPSIVTFNGEVKAVTALSVTIITRLEGRQVTQERVIPMKQIISHTDEGEGGFVVAYSLSTPISVFHGDISSEDYTVHLESGRKVTFNPDNANSLIQIEMDDDEGKPSSPTAKIGVRNSAKLETSLSRAEGKPTKSNRGRKKDTETKPVPKRLGKRL
jgi:hypothetical protein